MYLLVKSDSPTGGKDIRVKTLLRHLQHHADESDASIAVRKEALRVLINYAEMNAGIILDDGGIDSLASLLTGYAQDTSMLSIVLNFARNLAVGGNLCAHYRISSEESHRRLILGRIGFLLINALSLHMADTTVVEAGCWALGNLLLAGTASDLFGHCSCRRCSVGR
jgi:hypothetical protein